MPGSFLKFFIKELEPCIQIVSKNKKICEGLKTLKNNLVMYCPLENVDWYADLFAELYRLGGLFDDEARKLFPRPAKVLSGLTRRVWERLLMHEEPLTQFLIYLARDKSGNLSCIQSYLGEVAATEWHERITAAVQQDPVVMLLGYCTNLRKSLSLCTCSVEPCSKIKFVLAKIKHCYQTPGVLWAVTLYKNLRDLNQDEIPAEILQGSPRSKEVTQLCQLLFNVFKDQQSALLEAIFNRSTTLKQLHSDQSQDRGGKYKHIEQTFWQQVNLMLRQDSYVLLAGHLFALKEESCVGKSDNVIIKLAHLLEYLERSWSVLNARDLHNFCKNIIGIFSEDLSKHKQLVRKLDVLWSHLWENFLNKDVSVLLALMIMVIGDAKNKYAINGFLKFLKEKDPVLSKEVITMIDQCLSDFIDFSKSPRNGIS